MGRLTDQDQAAVQAHQRLIDELWDFADPAASEARLKAAAYAAEQLERDILLTQVARAFGVQGHWEAALELLEAVEGSTDPEVRVRVLLERGRLANTRGNPVAARPHFEAAFGAAQAAGFEHLAIDALHMVAITAAPSEQAGLNEQALALASAASDPRALDWRASLLNNLGWTRFEAGDHAEALALFEEALGERVRQGKVREIGIARWAVGRTLRALDRLYEALATQVDLARWLAAAELTDSHVEEEIGECLTLLGRADEAAPHFTAAANLLEAGGPGESADPERLARLRERATEQGGATEAQTSTTPEPGSG